MDFFDYNWELCFLNGIVDYAFTYDFTFTFAFESHFGIAFD